MKKKKQKQKKKTKKKKTRVDVEFTTGDVNKEALPRVGVGEGGTCFLVPLKNIGIFPCSPK